MFDPTPHQQALRDAVGALEDDLSVPPPPPGGQDTFPRDRWAALARTGLFAQPVNPEASRSERLLGTLHALERLGEISHDGGFGFSVATHLASTVTAVSQFGSEELKRRYLDDLTAGRLIGAHAISEPEAGSDAGAMATSATPDGDGFILSGEKAFVTNGPIADVVVVYARVEGEGVSPFLVESGSEGFRPGQGEPTFGLATAPLGPLRLEECRVPASHRLGKPGAGMLVLDHVMKREILYAFMINVGEMARRLERCVAQVTQRRQFGAPIGSFQAMAHRIADMKMRYELSRCWLYHAAEKLSRSADATIDVAIAKILVSESAIDSALDALQIHGGRGYLDVTGIGAGIADAVAGPIYSGTNEIQRSRIAAMMGVRA